MAREPAASTGQSCLGTAMQAAFSQHSADFGMGPLSDGPHDFGGYQKMYVRNEPSGTLPWIKTGALWDPITPGWMMAFTTPDFTKEVAVENWSIGGSGLFPALLCLLP